MFVLKLIGSILISIAFFIVVVVIAHAYLVEHGAIK